MKPHQVEKDDQTVAMTIWWPCSSPDISCCNSENWSQGNRNEPALKLQINWTWNSHSDADQTTSDLKMIANQLSNQFQVMVLFLHIVPLSLSIKALAPWIRKWGWPLDRSPPTPCVTGIWNKANFPFHQFCVFIGFWAVNSQTPLSITFLLSSLQFR